MIHFALISYSPNTAAMNRMRGYWNVMDSKGVDVLVSFLHQDNMKNKVEGEYEHIKFHYYDGLYGHNKLVVMFAFWRNLLRFSSSLKEGDIVYTYGINKVTSFLLKRKGIKLIAEVTEHPSILEGGRIVDLSAEERFVVARKLNGLITISESLKKIYVENGVNSNNVYVVNMLVDHNRFIGLVKCGIKARYITYCGTASNIKDGIDELIKAFCIVAKCINDVRLQIIWQTHSPDDASCVLQLINEMGIGDRIEFSSDVDYKMIPQMLTDATVLALDRPDSIQAQCGFPTKLGEYLLTGNPVVVTKVGDIPLFLKDGESALLANERDPEDFASKLIWVLRHPDESAVIGGKGKEVANKYFNEEIETEKLIKILNDQINEQEIATYEKRVSMSILMNKLQSFVKKTPIGRYLINYQLNKYTAPAHIDIRSEEEYLEILNNFSKCPGGTVICHNDIDSTAHYQYDLQVVIPVYKVEKYLRECVDSVIMQSTKYRIIVVLVDDGSPDECPKICDEYALKDKRIKVIHKQNGGLSSARNAGMKDIVANYIMFVDSDDRLINGSIDKLMGIAYSQKADIVQGSYHGLRGGKPTTKVGNNKTGPVEYTRLLGFAWGKVFKSDFFHTICFPEGFWFEDTINSFLIYPQSKCSWALSDVVYEYRVNKTGIISKSYNNPKALDSFWITRLSMIERKGDKYKNDLAYFQKLKKQFICNENRLDSAPMSVREAVFYLSASALLDVFPESIDFDGVTNNDRLFEKIIRDRNYKLFSRIARWL